MIKDLNIRPQTLKLVQERVGNTLELIGIGKDFLNGTPAAQQLRDSIDKWDFIKLKSFCSTKEMVSKLKRTLTEWEKIFANYTSDKGLITRIYRELKKLNSPKINKPIKKWASELNRTLSKEEIQMAKKHMKKCSPSLAIKEMQFKTTLRFHLTPVRIAIISNTTNNKCWRGPKRPKIVCSPSYTDIRSRANTARGLTFDHMIKREHTREI
jgi:single-stranded DNA-specific DHH superfamily exonuclease